ncbi:MAG: Ig-like domain-containing protein [Gemmatimonas sp.]
MGVGQQVTLHAGALDILGECDLPSAARVRWSSSDTGVARVDTSGTISARSAGTTEISIQVGRKRVRHTIIVAEQKR